MIIIWDVKQTQRILPWNL